MRREKKKKTSDFTPVGFSDVILPAKTPDNACLISGGREKKGKKRNGVHSRDAHTNTPTDDTREQTYGSGHKKKRGEKKNRKRHTLTPVLGHSFEQRQEKREVVGGLGVSLSPALTKFDLIRRNSPGLK